jgi:hypothetical protein
MTSRFLMLACLLSSAAGLMYEILWMRAFSLTLGSTTQVKIALRLLQRSGSGRGFSQPVFCSFSELPAQMHSEIIASDDFPAIEYSGNSGAEALFLNE